MQPELFISEVYRRMQARSGLHYHAMDWEAMRTSSVVRDGVEFYAPLLPEDKDAPILDIGFGSGEFIAVCILLGYTHIYGAEFGVEGRRYMYDWSPSVRALDEITTGIGDYLAEKKECFQFIHMSHVIEHLPKYTLLYHVDAMYQALTLHGTILLRCPNMDFPYANRMHYFVLGHEYGFSDNNLKQLLEICQFDQVCFHSMKEQMTLKQRLGVVLRFPLIVWEQVKRRLLLTNPGVYRGEELIVTAKRESRPPLFERSQVWEKSRC